MLQAGNRWGTTNGARLMGYSYIYRVGLALIHYSRLDHINPGVITK